jgi:hypothetical protein
MPPARALLYRVHCDAIHPIDSDVVAVQLYSCSFARWNPMTYSIESLLSSEIQ